MFPRLGASAPPNRTAVGCCLLPQPTAVLIHEELPAERKSNDKPGGRRASRVARRRTEIAPKPTGQSHSRLAELCCDALAAAVNCPRAKSTVALRLAVASLIGGADNWRFAPTRLHPDECDHRASMATGAALVTFAEQRRTVAGELAGGSEPTDGPCRGADMVKPRPPGDLCPLAGIERRAGGKGAGGYRRQALVAGAAWPNGWANSCKSICAVLAARRGIFGLLTDKAALAGIAAEIRRGPERQGDRKKLRASIRRRLHGEGRPPVEGWFARAL